MTLQEALNRLGSADGFWREALDEHDRAEPNAGYAGRLRKSAAAAAQEQVACLEVAGEGLDLEPLSRDEVQPLPYELQRGSGRVGPDALWARFDEIHDAWLAAWMQRDMRVLADAFGQLSEVCYELADAVDLERGVGTERSRREAQSA